mgnify:FL=1
MKDISYYWANKSQRANIAQEHTKQMNEQFASEIAESVINNKIYSKNFKATAPARELKEEANIILDAVGSVEAITSCKKADGKIAVLNFASYKNPGGMFIRGSRAQEECLCHESFLYNVLSQVPNYYEWNEKHKNKALYENRALYSPNIRFEHSGIEKYCDVITCAAPNFTAAARYCNVDRTENSEVLESRIRFVLEVARQNRVDTLILGAYGCGVFGQDANEVANVFLNLLITEYATEFKQVIFAIPVINADSTNYDAFSEVFDELLEEA